MPNASAKSGGSRKEIRKEQRRQRKQKKVEYFIKRKEMKNKMKKPSEPGKFVKVKNEHIVEPKLKKSNVKFVEKQDDRGGNIVQKEHELEKQKLIKLEKEMAKQRRRALTIDNEKEDKNIKLLEKKLKLNKRKSKTLPKSFVDCGLDYILDVCDSKNVEAAVNAEINLKDSDSEYEEDLALITGKGADIVSSIDGNSDEELEGIDSEQDYSDEFEEDNNMNSDNSSEFSYQNESDSCEEMAVINSRKPIAHEKNIKKSKTSKLTPQKSTSSVASQKNNNGNSCTEDSNKIPSKRKELRIDENIINSKKVKSRLNSESQDSEDEREEEENVQELWEDIYGRTRDKAGNVVQAADAKYIPPHLRETSLENGRRKEELERIRRQLKGLLNRLAENNIHNISNQIDEMYMKNSRNDMNETMLSLFTDSLITPVHTPERLIMEHAMLIAILQANVGTEVGAYFLQKLVKYFDELHSEELKIENKKLDNILLLLSHFYTFKVYNCELLYGILNCLCNSFKPKDIDLILVVLKSVGFTLRKDDPISLKQLILRVQKLANEASDMKEDARVRFMLDVLLGIKNNNVSKLPGYDPTHSEHLKKIIKPMFRKGNYVTELKISLEDLLKADERGRWWIVGSAWTGPAPHSSDNHQPVGQTMPSFSQEVLELAKKQRMNTANRKNIFCIIMTAEDYLDAFEKLLKLGLKGQPEQEIVHVLIHCLLTEKIYNPYYALVAEQLCISDRRHQMTIQCSVWDRFKELKNLKKIQISNLAKFLAHLFLQKSLPISVLKVVEFVEMDKTGVRLIRQVLMSILLFEDKECMIGVFNRISKSTKLAPLRQSLALFLHHFIRRKQSDEVNLTEQEKRLQESVQLVINTLNGFSEPT